MKEADGIPRCICGGIIKPDVVLYEEGLDSSVIRRAIRAISEADMLIIGGTDVYKRQIVTSPLVGTFYEAPAEGEAPYVKVGDIVQKGQMLAIVEAMKLMNDIESDFAGTVAEIYVANGEAVSYGQPLFRIVEGK